MSAPLGVTALGVERSSSLEAVRADWSRAAQIESVFATWEWAAAWWRHFGRDRELLLWTFRCLGEPVGVAPLYVSHTRPLHVARFVGHGPADELGPVCSPADARAVLEATNERLSDAGCDVLLAEQLAADRAPLAAGRLLRREASPVLRWDAGWLDYVASRSANLREQLGRRERRLRREGQVRFRLTTDAARLASDLDVLFRLHGAVRRRSDFGPEGFHRDVAAVALERGWLRLWTLELDERPAAVWLGFRVGGVESYYQAGRDPALDRLSVGFVLLAHTIRAALDDGIREYRFGRGDEPYKYRFATGDPGVATVAVGCTPLGSAVVRSAVAAASAARYLRSRIRNGPPEYTSR
jgi:CelD/BcsL family acetyltransferase involved in cellulose biosynthesis